MIETTQSIAVGVGIDRVWDYVRDIRRWAELMPGLQDCDIIDEDNSHWILKVGVGGLVRTVAVNVHVDQWAGPESALFSFKLLGDPVKGSGSYSAVSAGPNAIEMTLSLQVEGSGPMAPMWEAMGSPLLPKFALAFARQLAEGIEAEYSVTRISERIPASCPVTQERKPFAFLLWLWRALSARKQQSR